MRVPARLTTGPSWRPGHPVWDQGPAVQAHPAYVRDRYDAGSLLVGGPLRSGMARVALLEVADLEAAHAFADADPAVAADVLTYGVAEVRPYFDALGGVRRGGTTPQGRVDGSR